MIYVGKKVGKLEVLEQIGQKRWRCHCVCGKECKRYTCQLERYPNTSCGCNKAILRQLNSVWHEPEEEHYYWTIKEFAGFSERGTLWRCRCICGQEEVLAHSVFFNGWRKSCGCQRRGSQKDHLGARRYLFSGEMLTCRQIAVRTGLTLAAVRYRSKSPDFPGDILAPHRQGRRKLLITCKGQTHTLQEWSKIVGIRARTIYQRLWSGWEVERALTSGWGGKSESDHPDKREDPSVEQWQPVLPGHDEQPGIPVTSARQHQTGLAGFSEHQPASGT